MISVKETEKVRDHSFFLLKFVIVMLDIFLCSPPSTRMPPRKVVVYACALAIAIAHFRVALSLLFKPRPSVTINMKISIFHMLMNLFPYEWFCTWPWFEKEAKSNSEMGYWSQRDENCD